MVERHRLSIITQMFDARSKMPQQNRDLYRTKSVLSTPAEVNGHDVESCIHFLVLCETRLSPKSRFVDRITDLRFTRIGDDQNDAYRLFELTPVSSEKIYYSNHARWLFFDETLRDLFEMPHARFWYAIINCMEDHGLVFAFVPRNATSVTANISAMTMLTRKNGSLDTLYVCYMATRREHRRRGLATRLLHQVVQRALDERQHGVRQIIMHVNTLNIGALQLYERCGWRCYAYLPFYLDPEPHHATNHAYALRLHLDWVKNATALCRSADAVDVPSYDTEQSVQQCHRVPAQF